MFPNFAVLIATKRPLCRYVSLSITYVLSYRIRPKKIYIYIYIGGLCIDFSVYSARYVEVEPIYVAIGEKNRETILSSLQACFVIAHSSGDVIVKNIRTQRSWVCNSHQIKHIPNWFQIRHIPNGCPKS